MVKLSAGIVKASGQAAPPIDRPACLKHRLATGVEKSNVPATVPYGDQKGTR